MRRCRGDHTGKLLDPSYEFLEEGRPLRCVVVLGLRQRHPGNEDILLIESRIHPRDPPEAVHEQTSSGRHDQRQSHLCDDEHALHSDTAPFGAPAVRSGLDGVHQVLPGTVYRGDEPHQ